ncbi:MAG: hypothetical protein OXE40_02315 [Gammaproteobacteria bacterium]|nr:hypothetical protein [Gammaproteobacteria bacterium]
MNELLQQPDPAPEREEHLAIDELLQQPCLEPELKEDLAFVAGLVIRVERDVLRADQLHEALRSALLPDADWLELSFLANRNRRDARLNQAELQGRLGRLLDSGALSTTDQAPVRGLHRRLAAAQQYWYANDAPFECTTRYIETVLPAGSGASVKVQSRIVPGAAFGVHFAETYPRVGPLEQSLPVRHTHVPDLALSSLTNAKGQLLYSGMSHGVVTTELTGQALRRLPARELRMMIEALLLPGDSVRTVESSPTHRDAPKSPGRSPEARVAEYASQVRRSEAQADLLAAFMRKEACRVIGNESLAAALFADQDKLRRALMGQTVELNPLSIVLVTQEDIDQWHGYRPDFLELPARTGPVVLSVRGPSGSPREVRVQLTGNRHQFVVSADEGELDLNVRTALENSKALEWLLGPAHREEEPGALAECVASTRARAADLRQGLVAPTLPRRESTDAAGASDQRLLVAGHTLLRKKGEADFLARSARTLEHAGQQLRAIRMDEPEWPYVIRSGRRVAARVALAGHLMGMLPMVSCMSAKDVAACLDAEIKFCATVADGQDGRLPPVNPNPEVWDSARGAFAPR